MCTHTVWIQLDHPARYQAPNTLSTASWRGAGGFPNHLSSFSSNKSSHAHSCCPTVPGPSKDKTSNITGSWNLRLLAIRLTVPDFRGTASTASTITETQPLGLRKQDHSWLPSKLFFQNFTLKSKEGKHSSARHHTPCLGRQGNAHLLEAGFLLTKCRFFLGRFSWMTVREGGRWWANGFAVPVVPLIVVERDRDGPGAHQS